MIIPTLMKKPLLFLRYNSPCESSDGHNSLWKMSVWCMEHHWPCTSRHSGLLPIRCPASFRRYRGEWKSVIFALMSERLGLPNGRALHGYKVEPSEAIANLTMRTRGFQLR